ncbi:putative inactive receptor kinase [Canna indica]|uniref:Inactive receptor kinase n=1 Tax=Canna indica TaxID=4628 RepID=A0AAQ3KCI1_9LILI|nr:putative inactive receptor kinase [Canna indica]
MMHCVPRFPRQLLLLFLLLLSYSIDGGLPSAAASPQGDARALLAFKAAADSRGRLPFSLDSDHCQWSGISCSADGTVTRLLLDSAGLAGTFPNATLGRLDQLRFLSLRDNALAGPIPGDLAGLRRLEALFLDGNLFAGPFPSAVLSLTGLRALGLSHNRLSGAISPALAALDGLVALRLEANRFGGSLPAFNQSSLKNFNVSGNNLSGTVPVTVVLASFDPSAFADNPRLCGALVQKECSWTSTFFPKGGNSPADTADAPSPTTTAAPQRAMLLPDSAAPPPVSHKRTEVAIGFLIGAVVLIGIFTASLVVKKRKRMIQQRQRQGELLTSEKEMMNCANSATEINVESYNEEIENMSNELEAATAMAMAISEERVKRLGKNGCLVFCAGEPPVYTLEQLMRASAEMLGRGSLGSTYKAVLGTKFAVTVKRLDKKKLGAGARDLFDRNMEIVGRLRHPNLVPLRAYFRANDERLLVYDYQPNGSLYSLIHGSRSTRAKPLHWTSCLKIADDVAQGLAYIHQASRLIHGNIKSSNILLGSDFEACLTDNCLSFLLDPSDNHNDSGYRAPETRISDQQLTPSSDIYAFGVLLLELLTGKPPVHHPILIPSDLLVWVQSVREDGVNDEYLMMIIEIAAACIHSSPECRPTAWQVLKMIQEVKEANTGDNEYDSICLS